MGFADKTKIENAQKVTLEYYQNVNNFHNTLMDDHSGDYVCENIAEYQKNVPSTFLERAAKKINQRKYNICFAGGFSGGKSTLINALLGHPGLLPAEAGECTMTITSVGCPNPGEQEHVEVVYFAKNVVVENIRSNSRYKMWYDNYVEDLDADSEKFATITKKVCEDIAGDTEGDPGENSKKREELQDLLLSMDTYANRLGRPHIDTVDNSSVYLTTDENSKGLGHLLLIEQVNVFINNPLFVENGIQIIDLPGIDSPNARQKELTFRHLEEADVVLMVIEPKGFKMADIQIGSEMGSHNNDIKNKIFIVMNMFDKLSAVAVTKDQIHKLYISQVEEECRKNGLRTDRIYLTSALRVELQARKNKGIITDGQEQTLESIIRDCSEKNSGLESGIRDDLKAKMQNTYENGGIQKLQDSLVNYLTNEIALERCAEIEQDLLTVSDFISTLLESERGRVADQLNSIKSFSGEILEFMESVDMKLKEEVRFLDINLDKAMAALAIKVKEKVKASIKAFENYPMDKIRARVSPSTPSNIKMEAINLCKEKFCADFIEAVVGVTVPPIDGKMMEQIDKSGIRRVMEYFEEQLEEDYLKDFNRDVENFSKNLNWIAKMRSSEDTWEVRDLDIKPSGHDANWTDAIEVSFKNDLIQMFTDKLVGNVDKLLVQLGRYYSSVLNQYLDSFSTQKALLERAVRNNPDIPLPTNLLTGEELSPEDARKEKLVQYFTDLKNIEKAKESVKSALH